ncbi:MAG: Lrp/AsnC family transcriptional regulator [Colwellia sp.]
MNKMKPLDRIDYSILKVLQSDGRISNVALAQKVGLSASPCLDRVKRLEQEGYIRHYGAFLDAKKLNYSMTAFIQVNLNKTTSNVLSDFKKEVLLIKEVAECHLIAGGFDYLLKIRFSDMENYRIVLNKVAGLPQISQTTTYIATENVKEHGGVPF